MKNNKLRDVDKNLNELLGVKKKITDETIDFDLKNAKNIYDVHIRILFMK